MRGCISISKQLCRRKPADSTYRDSLKHVCADARPVVDVIEHFNNVVNAGRLKHR